MIEDTITLNVIREAKEEKRDAMQEMVAKFQPVLFYIASCHLKSDALIRETVKTCLGNLFVLLSETEDLSAFNAKAMSGVVRTCLNAVLKEEKGHDIFPAEGSDPGEPQAVYTDTDEIPAKQTAFTEKEAMNIVVNMVRTLPDDQRILFVMRYLDGIPFARISEMIHVPEETLKKRAQLAKAGIAQNLSRSVEDIFGIAELAEQNKYLILEEEPETENLPAEDKPDARPKKHGVLWLTAAAAVLIAAVLCGAFLFRRPEPVSVQSYLQCSFTGVNGAGSASAVFAETGNEKLNSILSESSCIFRDYGGKPVDEGTLSNGDELRLACSFDETKQNRAHLAIEETDFDVTVEGLKDPEVLDLFPDLSFRMEVNEETGEYELKAASADPTFAEVQYQVKDLSEEGVRVYAKISDETLLSYGYTAKSHYRVYSEDEIPDEVRSTVRRMIMREGLESAADHIDAYGAEYANGSDPFINALAEKYIGRGGACNEIANAFIYELYGVRVHTGYSRQNMYEVDAPEPGDLIYYFNSYGSYTHVATYIGNGLVLNGNYADGRAHITSMYESLYAANPMVFLRVER